MDDMIGKSTAIVRGRVAGSRAELHKSIVYTHFTVQVVERYKGAESGTIDVVVPGGQVGGVRQRLAGTPNLTVGAEYVLFLWKGRNQLNQVIGLSQGVFNMAKDASGQWVLSRDPVDATLVDRRTGLEVSDQPVRMSLRELERRVRGKAIRE